MSTDFTSRGFPLLKKFGKLLHIQAETTKTRKVFLTRIRDRSGMKGGSKELRKWKFKAEGILRISLEVAGNYLFRLSTFAET